MQGEKTGSTKTFSMFPCWTSLAELCQPHQRLLLVTWGVMREAKAFWWLLFSSGSAAVCHQHTHQGWMLCAPSHSSSVADLSGTGPQGCAAVYWSPARVCSTGHYAGPRHWASFQSIWIFWALADVIPFFSRFKYTMLPVAFLPSVFLLVFLRSPLNPLLWWWENAPQGLLLLFFFQLLQTLFMALQHSRFFSFWLLPPELYVVQYHSHPCVWRNSANFSYSVLHYSVSTSC